MNDIEQMLTERMRENSFSEYNHIELKEAMPDHCTFTLTIRPESRNTYGMVHGGLIASMADQSAGCAAHTDGRYWVTQNCSMHYLRNQGEGTVEARSFVKHRGNSTCLVEVEIIGTGGKLLAVGDFTFFRVDRDLMMQKKRENEIAAERERQQELK